MDDLAPLPHGFGRGQLAAAISPRVQELILLPTEKCNFRCTYCYEDFKISGVPNADLYQFLESGIVVKTISRADLAAKNWNVGTILSS